MTISVKKVNRLSLDDAVASFPIDRLVFLLLLTQSVDLNRFLEMHQNELQNAAVSVFVLPEGFVWDGIFAAREVPMIASFINRAPIAVASLVENLGEFFSHSFNFAAIILRETEQA